MDTPEAGGRHGSLREVAGLFLRLGATAFGGPAAHIAMMQAEVVGRRKWVTREQFLDLLGASNLIPGPTSTEMAIHLGYLRAGVPGLIVAGLCFCLPASLIVTALAWAYVRYGTVPGVAGLLYGAKPAVIAIIAQALYGFCRTTVKGRVAAAVGIGCIAAHLLGLGELALLLAAGMAVSSATWMGDRRKHGLRPLVLLLACGSALLFGPWAATSLIGYRAAAARVGLWALFSYFLKIGSVLYGSGYVLLAFLRSDLVVRRHWITAQQLLDATAVGQATPGPLFTTATFIGYILAGPVGALVATVGIFLPAFAFVGISAPVVARLRASALAGSFLSGVTVGSLALMAVVTGRLAVAAVVDLPTAAIAAASAFALVRLRVTSGRLILAGAVVGFLVRLVAG